MSRLHLLLNDVLNELYRPSFSSDQQICLGSIEELQKPRLFSVPLRLGNLQPWHMSPKNGRATSFDRDKITFAVNLSVQQFKPEEIAVKVTDDFIIVEAKHEEREDEYGFVSRQLIRRYKIPSGTDLDKLKSTLSSDGVLLLSAPKKNVQIDEDRKIPIIQTNKPALTKGYNGVDDENN